MHLRIVGKVQGVWFRESTKDRALELGLRGWVKNLPDGSVEALVEGDSAEVEQLIAFCRRGPELARVDQLSVEERPVGADLGPFVVER